MLLAFTDPPKLQYLSTGTNRIKRSEEVWISHEELFVSDYISETTRKSVVASDDCEIVVKNIKVRYSI